MKPSFNTYKNELDKISPTFCSAKWLNSTIWLEKGKTASCHHPPAHSINSEEIKNNPSALHNTAYKKQVRQELLDGKQTQECDYCWKVENNTKEISDRVHKSIIHYEYEGEFNSTDDYNPRTLEISFDRLCNFACVYCNQDFSTRWENDIKTNGSYKGFESYGSYSVNQHVTTNAYKDAFWKWWNSTLQDDLVELRVTGGEALMSKDFWKLLDCWNPKIRLALNTNLGINQNLLGQLLPKLPEKFHLYTSMETHGKQAELIRRGCDYEEWLYNLKRIKPYCEETHVMLTVNALSLEGMDEFLRQMNQIKQQGNHFLSFNILRFPDFLSVNVLKKETKQKYADMLKNVDTSFWEDFEKSAFKRLISYLENIHLEETQRKSMEEKHARFIKQYFSRF